MFLVKAEFLISSLFQNVNSIKETGFVVALCLRITIEKTDKLCMVINRGNKTESFTKKDNKREKMDFKFRKNNPCSSFNWIEKRSLGSKVFLSGLKKS